MNDSSTLCMSCGLCCDGTVIGYVQLNREEMPTLKKIMEVEDTKGNGFFIQPCSSFCDGCTIYAQRPQQCALYKCAILKSVEQHELDFDSALTIINLVKHKKIAIEKNLAILQLELESQSFYYKMIELKNLFQNNITESLTSNHLELIADVKQLDRLLSNKLGITLR